MRKRLTAATVMMLATGAASADTLTCRNGKILQPGMSEHEAISKCGEPTSKDVKWEDTRAVNAAGYSIKTGQRKIETWRYDRGRQKPAAVLVIEEGKIVSIKFE
jgi:hypothetical protein